MLSRVLLLSLVLVALSAVAVLGSGRDVRSYVNEMEYVDHVDLKAAAADDSPVSNAKLAHANADHAMMETESHPAAQEAAPMHFSMSSDAEAEADPFGMAELGLLEVGSEEHIDTAAIRAMALEISDAAMAQIGDDNQVLLELATDVEADAAVSDAEVDELERSLVEAESSVEKKSHHSVVAQLKAKLAEEKEARKEAEQAAEAAAVDAARAEAKLKAVAPVLSPEELAQEKKDQADEAAAKLAEKKDLAEELNDKKEDQEDVRQVKEAVAVVRRIEAAERRFFETHGMNRAHKQTIDANEAATRTITGAMKEMSSILTTKDRTIRSLVANVTYLTVQVGKLTNRVDLQSSYIGLLKSKLAAARAKNQRLDSHVKHSNADAAEIRAQLAAIAKRLSHSETKSKKLHKFLKKHAKKHSKPVPALKNYKPVKKHDRYEPSHAEIHHKKHHRKHGKHHRKHGKHHRRHEKRQLSKHFRREHDEHDRAHPAHDDLGHYGDGWHVSASRPTPRIIMTTDEEDEADRHHNHAARARSVQERHRRNRRHAAREASRRERRRRHRKMMLAADPKPDVTMHPLDEKTGLLDPVRPRSNGTPLRPIKGSQSWAGARHHRQHMRRARINRMRPHFQRNNVPREQRVFITADEGSPHTPPQAARPVPQQYVPAAAYYNQQAQAAPAAQAVQPTVQQQAAQPGDAHYIPTFVVERYNGA